MGPKKIAAGLLCVFAIAVGLAGIATVLGIYASSWQGSNIPMGPAVVGAAALLLALVWPAAALARRAATRASTA